MLYAQEGKASTDSIGLAYPFSDGDAFGSDEKSNESGLYLQKPSNIQRNVEYDGDNQMYIITETIGGIKYRLPRAMSLEEYAKYDLERSVRGYWESRNKTIEEQVRKGIIPTITIDSEAFSKVFGGSTIDIVPQGFVEVTFGVQTNSTENPAIPERIRKVTTFDFDQQIQMSASGTVGDKMKMRFNYNTESTFSFENQMSLEYTGDEDEILKKVEAGNVSLPLNGSLITGATNLFGVKTDMQFGKLSLTTVLSQSEGERRVVDVEGGAQYTEFEISAANYDQNRHFFLSHFFRDSYDKALANLPVVRSGFTINKIEIWVTNKSGNYENARNIVGMMDLGEHSKNMYNSVPDFQESTQSYPYSVVPWNGANNMYASLTTKYSNIRDAAKITTTMNGLRSFDFYGGQDYEKIEQARKLNPSEYTVNSKLGYISLSSALNADEVLAVAYNYTYNGQVFQVGEFSTDGVDAPQTLVLKLLKGTNQTPSLPTWDLMMKNIYSLNTFSLSEKDFKLNVMYQNDLTGTKVNYLPGSNLEGRILLDVLNLDNLNSQLDLGSNGVFDYVEGVTVNSSSGRIIFPVLEPFGSYLEDLITSEAYKRQFAYTTLYDSTQVYAEQDAKHNKFYLVGSYAGSSASEISLGAINLVQGSVKVSSGGVTLVEGVDYVVDYILGRVQIINSAYLESGASLQVSTESQDLFTVQRKTLLGTHANYAFSDRFNLGGTLLYLNERPITQKVNYGEDPLSNIMWGLNVNYNNEAPFITNLVNKIPFIETNAKSSIAVEAEMAQLITTNNAITNGIVYIDDFEATQSTIDLRQRQDWMLASVPQHQQSMFPEAHLDDSVAVGYNRAKIAWYAIDPLFTRNTQFTPAHIKSDLNQQSDNLVREIFQREIYPNKDLEVGVATTLSVLNLAYYPEERGPYNFDTKPSLISEGLNADGMLNKPETRWGGIMRAIETTNFQAANIEYIEFWLMDPFVNDEKREMSGADLYFNLGDISEDVLRDSRKMYENGLPENNNNVFDVDTTTWGRVPTQAQITNAFISSDGAILSQDVGFDGLGNEDERSFYANYLQTIRNIVDPTVYESIEKDPSGDDYHYYRGSDYDAEERSVLDRYKLFNGVEGNSIPATSSPESYATSATTIPDNEDINNDNTLNEYERYYQYRVSLRPQDMVVGQNNITDARTVTVEVPNGNTTVTWYRFRVPISEPDAVCGNISNFTSIRFMRMFLKNSEDPIHLRFASLDLVRADWRKYSDDLETESNVIGENTSFNVTAVNIEEDGNRSPVNYVLPPGVDRVIDPGNAQRLALNEQALAMKISELEQGDSRAVFKSINMDFRRYKNIKLDVHAEEVIGSELNDGDLHFFVRMGTDYTHNYYEYELPLSLTKHRKYSSDVEADRYAVWPDANRLDLPFSVFTDTKLERNAEIRLAGSTSSLTDEYVRVHANYNSNRNLIKIKGNPTLGDVRVMMFGVRHKDGTLYSVPKSIEVWVNELRLTEIEDNGGWAAAGRTSVKLADLGNVVFSGRYSSAGFGAIDQTVTERSLNNLSEYDISTNLELGKFFPEEARVQIPLYAGVSKRVSTPDYDPINTDIKLKESLAVATSKAEKDSIRKNAQAYSKYSSVILNNVKVDKVNKSGVPRIYDPTNFAISYAQTRAEARDENTQYDIERTTRVAFNYNYSNAPKVYEPFRQIKSPYLRLVRDFNFSLMPSLIAYNTEFYRYYNEIQTRNITNVDFDIPLTVEKDFLWTNNFDLSYNLTKALKLDFSSQGTRRIDEAQGRMNRADTDYEMKRDSLIRNLLDGGRPVLYRHSLNLTYQLPINKIRMLDWVSSTARYQALYNWNAGPITDESIQLGNTIDNSLIMQLNGQANFSSLYNKVPYLKSINQRFSRRSRQASTRTARTDEKEEANDDKQEKPKKTYMKTVTYKKAKVELVQNQPTTIKHNLKTSDVTVRVFDSEGKQVRGITRKVDDNTITFTARTEISDAQIEITGKKEMEQTFARELAAHSARLLMMVKSGSVTYSNSTGSALPGFLPSPSFFGGGDYTSSQVGFGNVISSFAPGVPFLLGWQDESFAAKAAEKGWITTDSTLNSPFIMSSLEVWNFRLNLEPINSLKIDLTSAQTRAERVSEFYLYNADADNFFASNKNLSGSFSMSINTWRTAFDDMGEAGVQESLPYQEMLTNRLAVAKRLAAQRQENKIAGYDPTAIDPRTGFPLGYGPTSQEVLIPAFIAAYTGQSPEKVSLNPFPSLRNMRPNWRLTYNGDMSKIDVVNNYIKSVALAHSYQSTYNVGQYQSNLNYNNISYGDGHSYAMDANNNFVPNVDITTVSITELFNPLFNFDITWVNDLSTSVQFNRARNMSLSLTNNQMTEVISREYSMGLGYRFPRMDIFIKGNSKQKSYSNDLNIRADLAVRKNKTVLRKLVEDNNQLTAGQKVVTLRTSADYSLSERFQLRFYYDKTINNPFTSNAFPTATSNFGMSFRFMLIP